MTQRNCWQILILRLILQKSYHYQKGPPEILLKKRKKAKDAVQGINARLCDKDTPALIKAFLGLSQILL